MGLLLQNDKRRQAPRSVLWSHISPPHNHPLFFNNLGFFYDALPPTRGNGDEWPRLGEKRMKTENLEWAQLSVVLLSPERPELLTSGQTKWRKGRLGIARPRPSGLGHMAEDRLSRGDKQRGRDREVGEGGIQRNTHKCRDKLQSQSSKFT